MASRILAPLLVLALLAEPAFAQSADEAEARMNGLLAAQADAEAGAARPGDEALTCEALQAELMTSANDPEFQAMLAANGAFAQDQLARAGAARGQMAGSMAMGMGLGLASAFIPGLGMVSGMAMRAQAGAMQQQAQDNMQAMTAMGDGMAAHMPRIYRMQRIVELGQAKQCAFTQEPGAVPGQ